jgi:hypothetical protein
MTATVPAKDSQPLLPSAALALRQDRAWLLATPEKRKVGGSTPPLTTTTLTRQYCWSKIL